MKSFLGTLFLVFIVLLCFSPEVRRQPTLEKGCKAAVRIILEAPGALVKWSEAKVSL
jgi:hypothetical protein